MFAFQTCIGGLKCSFSIWAKQIFISEQGEVVFKNDASGLPVAVGNKECTVYCIHVSKEGTSQPVPSFIT